MNSNSPLCLLLGTILSPFGSSPESQHLVPAPVIVRNAAGRLEEISTPKEAWNARAELREFNRLLARTINGIPNPGAAFDDQDLRTERERFDRTARRVCAIPGVGETLAREVGKTREVLDRLGSEERP